MLHGYNPPNRFLPYLSWTEIAALPDRENTVIVIASDHGEAFYEHGQIGHSTTLYDEELRSTLMIRAPLPAWRCWAQKNEERKAESFLVKTYRDLFDNYEQVKKRRSQREAFGKALELTLEVGKAQVSGFNPEEVLQTQRDFVNALRQEAQSVAAYGAYAGAGAPAEVK